MKVDSPNGTDLILLVIVCSSGVAFGGGLVLPLFSIYPGAGEWTSLAHILAPTQMQKQTVTLVGGIRSVWTGGEFFLAILLALFSLMLPIIKLSVLSVEAFVPNDHSSSWRKGMKIASRYAMVEVFVIALLVVLVKGLPSGGQITIQAGTYAFSTSVMLGLVGSQLERVRRKRVDPSETGFESVEMRDVKNK